MKKLTTQATISSYINQDTKEPIVQSIMAFINNTHDLFLSREKIDDIQMVLSEAINNVVVFAYPNKQGKVTVHISIYDNKVLKLKVRDFGCGIEDIEKARAPFFTTETGHSGMGFAIMKTFSDKLTVKSILGKGTIVTMEFKM